MIVVDALDQLGLGLGPGHAFFAGPGPALRGCADAGLRLGGLPGLSRLFGLLLAPDGLHGFLLNLFRRFAGCGGPPGLLQHLRRNLGNDDGSRMLLQRGGFVALAARFTVFNLRQGASPPSAGISSAPRGGRHGPAIRGMRPPAAGQSRRRFRRCCNNGTPWRRRQEQSRK